MHTTLLAPSSLPVLYLLASLALFTHGRYASLFSSRRMMMNGDAANGGPAATLAAAPAAASVAGGAANVGPAVPTLGFATRAIHVGCPPDPGSGAVVPPISVSSSMLVYAVGAAWKQHTKMAAERAVGVSEACVR